MTKSKIFLYLCLSFIIGVFLASLIKIPGLMLAGFFVLGLILVSIFWSKNPEAEQARYRASKKAVVAGFCLIILAFGVWRFSQKQSVGNLDNFNGQGRLVLTAQVAEAPDRRSTSQKLKVEAQTINIGRQKFAVNGFALATAGLYPEINYGDQLAITGKLEEPKSIEDFDYKSYLAKSDIYSVIYYPEIKIIARGQGSRLKSALFWLKQRFENSLNKILPEPQASFLAGLTLGETRSLPQYLTEDFQKTGTTHIIALSGYNITRS